MTLTQLQASDRLGEVSLLRRLGIGGMGELWLGRTSKGEDVAVKVLFEQFASDQTYLNMFIDEARIAAQLDHPGIVRLLSVGSEDGWHYHVYEYLDGVDLSKLLGPLRRAKTAVPLRTALWIASEAAAAIAYAHAAKSSTGQSLDLVHRDITPANIFLTREGRVVIIDFGIARVKERITRTQAGVVKGKLGYMAPEHLKGAPTAPSFDIFSLGVVLWEVLALRRLFAGSSDVEVLNAICAGEVPPIDDLRDDVPPALADLVSSMLCAEASERPASMREVADRLTRMLPPRVRRSELKSGLSALLTASLPTATQTAQLLPMTIRPDSYPATDPDATLADPPRAAEAPETATTRISLPNESE